MQCRSCGSALVTGAKFCPNCGNPVTEEESEFSSYEYSSDDQPSPIPPVIEQPAAPSTPNQLAFRAQQGAQQGSIDHQSPARPQAPVFPGQQFGPAAQQYPPQQEYSSPQYYQGTMPTNQGNFQLPPGLQPQSPSQPTPPTSPKRRGLSPALVVLLVVLALLVGAGGVFAYYAIAHRSTPPSQATATSTRTIPTITTTDPQQIYTQATSGTPTINDPLNASNPNGWEGTNSSDKCKFTGRALEVSTTATASGQIPVAICVATATNFANFAYQVSTTISQGSATGIVFRTDPFAKAEYLFGVGTTGTYALLTVTTNSTGQANSSVLSAGLSQAIHTGVNQSNLLTVIARGSAIDLYANQQYLASVTDNTATGGVLGVFGENTQPGGAVDVLFTSIKVWQL